MKMKWIGPWVTRRVISTEDFAAGGFPDEQPIDIFPQANGEKSLYCEVSDEAGAMLIRSEPGMWQDVTDQPVIEADAVEDTDEDLDSVEGDAVTDEV